MIKKFFLEKANLTTICLQKLDDIGVKVTSVTCDGPAVNLAMLKKLGASVEPDNIKSEIEILVAQKPVNILLDNCHCIKLVRNTFSDLGEMKDGDGETIQWCFIARLYELQSMELCHLANKITRNHVFW